MSIFRSLSADLDKWLRDLSGKDEASAAKFRREMSGELRALVKGSELSEELTALLEALDRSDGRTDAKSSASSSRSESRRSIRDKSRDDK